MRVPISWLRAYADLPQSTDNIADRLAMLGFPVAEIVRRPEITGVVVGRIATLDKHPNADRLQVGSIDVGDPAHLTIATAATNVAAGQTIAVATIGARLPHLTIERRKMRGLESEGMMISAEELALPAEWFEDGILQLDPETPLGVNAVEYFGLHEDVLDVEITSNRPDAMCIVGLARELAASFGVALRAPSSQNPGVDDDADVAPQVRIETPACRRFIAQRFDNISVGNAPAWMRIRLALAGQRPINNLVDISNYVMFEVGQPLHFYDASCIENGELVVRDAHAGEAMTTLDDKPRSLTPAMPVIADAKGPLAIAGVMGAKNSEVSGDTRAIVLESATFSGSRVRSASASLGIRTEASSRHEKTLAPAMSDDGAARAAQLLESIGAHAYRPHAFGDALQPNATIALTPHDVTRILGITIDAERMAANLRALDFHVDTNGDGIVARAPARRTDVTIAADIVEEIARVEGYDSIVAIEPTVAPHAISSAQYLLENAVADHLAALGYHEINTYALLGQGTHDRLTAIGYDLAHVVEVRNPLSEDQKYLRWALGPGMLAWFARVQRPIRAFEIGHMFSRDAEAIIEEPAVAFSFSAPPLDEPAWRDTHFLRIKGDTETLFSRLCGITLETAPDKRRGFHPGKTAALIHDGREIALVGKIDPRASTAFGNTLSVYTAMVYLDRIPEFHAPTYRIPSRYPSTFRDLAPIVPNDVEASLVTRVAARAAGPLCSGVRVIDEYRGTPLEASQKSLTVRMDFVLDDATITDAQADAATAHVTQTLIAELGAIFRQ